MDQKNIRLVQGIKVSLVFALLNILGMALAIPPEYASPLFPAAGFALVATLFYGAGVLPYLGLASFTTGLGSLVLYGATFHCALIGALGVAIGVVLQAALGARLVTQSIGDGWRRLENEGEIRAFLIQGGLLGCLASATVSVVVLVGLGVSSQERVFLTWWTWYSGDLLGVVIFSPLALPFMVSDSKLAGERRRRIVGPICIALVLSLIAYVGVANIEQEKIQSQLTEDTAAIAKRIQSRIVNHQAVLSSLHHFVKAQPDFSYAQFIRFTEAALVDNQDLFALSFNDVVPRSRLERYVAEIRKIRPNFNFRVSERDSEQNLIPVGERPEYVIVRHIVPLEGNAAALGFDIYSDPIRRDAIVRARVSGTTAVTAPIRLVQETDVRQGVLLLEPVRTTEGFGADNSSAPSGFAVAVIKVDELIELATRGHVPAGLHFQVSDVGADEDSQRFYQFSPPQEFGKGVYRWRELLPIADRHWVLDVWAGEDYIRGGRPWLSWVVGVVALLFTGLLQIYLHGISGREVAIQRKTDLLQENQAELQLAKTVYESTADGIVVTDTVGDIVSINPAFTAIAGYSLAEIQGRNISLLSWGLKDGVSYEALWGQLLLERQWQGEVVNRRKSGESYTARLSITAVSAPDGVVNQYVFTFSDITEQKRALDRIETLAYYDVLTELPNRSLGKQMAEEAISRARRHGHMVGIVFMDLDNFKLINDTCGHSIGDHFLQAVAQRLRASVRPEDCVCRLSGDEFMLVLGHIRKAGDIAARCQNLLAEMGKPYEIDGRLLLTSLSAGVAVYPADGNELEQLLRKADTAMFEAKHEGRNTYRFFDPLMNQRVVVFVETRDALAEAVRKGEFELYYQPQVRLRDQVVVGAEALIRWRHPQRGLLGPSHFIEVAEQSGLIVPIGTWVLQKAIRQMEAWRAAGVPIETVAVNLSAIQFRGGDVEKTITDALSLAGLPPECLELELTESILLRDQDEMLARMARLKALGLRLSIDDFGTGYSSLAYLKRFPADKIKIDASFAAGVDRNSADAAIVRSIVQMAQALGMETTAEGVEELSALNIISQLGCTYVQGYCYAPPMEAAEFANWVSNYKKMKIGDADF